MAHILGNNNLLDAEEIISYRFTELRLLREALDLSSGVTQERQKKLALLGDRVIKLFLTEEGLSRDANLEQINLIMCEKESKPHLTRQGFFLGLDECIFKNPCQGNRIYPGPIIDTMKAIIAAVYYDSVKNVAAVEGVMEKLGVTWPSLDLSDSPSQ